MITIEALQRYFDGGDERFYALKDIDLYIGRGECVVLKGVSGSGKTTLLGIIGGLDKPSSGKVLVDGEPISKLPDLHLSNFRAQKIGIIFQHYNLMDHLTSRENILVPLIPVVNDMHRVEEMTDAAMKLASISHKADMQISRLSGGEKQRVAIARAVVSDPDIILCDEPTANLDRDNSLKFIESIQMLHQLGKTVVIATHDPLFDNLPFKSRVVHLEEGRLV